MKPLFFQCKFLSFLYSVQQSFTQAFVFHYTGIGKGQGTTYVRNPVLVIVAQSANHHIFKIELCYR